MMLSMDMNRVIASFIGRKTLIAYSLAVPHSPITTTNNSFTWAIKNNKFQSVKTLLTFPNIDPSVNNNDAIKWASSWGYDKVVNLLLTDSSGRVDPSVDNNDAIYEASDGGYDKVVALLLKDPRVDPSEAIIVASDG